MTLYSKRYVVASILTIVGIFVYGSSVSATNLVTNGDFSAGDATGWTIIENGGSGATFGGGVYATSYTWNSISQTINLVAAGYTADQLDAEPNIVFNVDTMQRFDHDGYYYLEYKLLGADGTTVIDSKLYGSVGSPIYLTPSTAWFSTEYTFSGYGAGARYAYIKIAGQDGAPNWAGQYGPYFDNVSVSFADSTNPSILYTNPADDASSVAVDSTFEIAFDEAIATSTGNIIIYKADDDSIVETIAITSNQVTASSTNALIIDPADVLLGQTDFYIIMDATAVDDLAGNSFAGITASSTWSFTTAPTPACPTIANTQSYNAYPTCGVAQCVHGYALIDGACSASGGGAVTSVVPFEDTVTDTQLEEISHEIADDPVVEDNDSESSPTTLDSVVQPVLDSEDHDFAEGMLLKIPGSATVYLVATQKIRPFFDELAFISHGYNWMDIVEVDSIALPVGEMIYAPIVGNENKLFEYFIRDLQFGSEGEDVRTLQKILNQNGFVLTETGAGSPGNETVYFRERTQNSVQRFQVAYDLLPADGYVGFDERQVLDELVNN